MDEETWQKYHQQKIDEGWERSKAYWLSKGLTDSEAEVGNFLSLVQLGSLPTKYRELRRRVWAIALEEEPID